MKVVSLFSGCGGLDLGFLGGFEYHGRKFPGNGYRIIFANDFDPAAVKVYEKNKKYFGSHKCLLKDIKEINELDVPPFDILLAGFPCQPFSNAGNRQGIKDKHGRGTLFYECEKFLKRSEVNGGKPAAFVFENVRGILSTKMPHGTTIPEEIVNRTRKLGYRTVYKLLKASDYGVPQNRYRVIMVGVREDLPQFDFNWMDKVVINENLPNKRNPYELYLGAILCDIPKDALGRNDIWKYSPSTQKMISKIGPCEDGQEALAKFSRRIPLEDISDTISKGRSWKNIPPEEMTPRFKKIYENPKKYRAPNFYRRWALGEICGTITASGQPENCGITHPYKDRRFSIREIARIQTFPDDFEFPFTSISNAYKVLGNAVPPVFGWVISKALDYHLKGHNIEN
jgi:DNA (cytosine-5)-methyltransferase 1